MEAFDRKQQGHRHYHCQLPVGGEGGPGFPGGGKTEVAE